MLKIKQTIIVEGKYDKAKLSSIVDANIIATDGFRIFKNEAKRVMIKHIAEKTGVIILTDSDMAGRRIRNFIKNCVGKITVGDGKIINAYIPKIEGKERRKAYGSREGTLGVEGVDKDILLDVLKKFGASESESEEKNAGDSSNGENVREISKGDFYVDGLAGGKGCVKKREWFCEKLGVPYMQANALLECANIMLDFVQYKKIMSEYE